MPANLTRDFNKPLGDPKNYPLADPDTDILRLLHRTADESIAFVHVFPPQHGVTASTFFGGLPLVPAGFEWPRSAKRGEPLSFMGQVDCAALPHIQLRSFLPESGTLYFFVGWDLFSGPDEVEETKNYVIYEAGSTSSLKEACPPADLLPVYGRDACYYNSWLEHTDHAKRDYPRTFTKLAMRMDTLLTFAEEHPTEYDGNSAGRYQALWQTVQTDEMRRVYGQPIERGPMLQASSNKTRPATVWRPFPAFPHAWLAVEMVCGELLKAIKEACGELKRGKVLSDEDWPADPAAHHAIYDQVAAEAANWIATARDQGLMTGPSNEHKAAFWTWLDGLQTAAGSSITEQIYDIRGYYTLNRCIEWSAVRASDECAMFSASSAALVPSSVVNELRYRHSPLVERGGSTGGRHQMLGHGRNVQGAPERMEGTHILLMQLDTDAGLNWLMGDCGALQYWITLDDLRAKRFDRVEVTLEGY